jgi:hypothetical protein
MIQCTKPCPRILFRGIISLLPLLLSACGQTISDSYAPGPIDHSLYRKAVEENEDRLAVHGKFVDPFSALFDYLSKDTGITAAHNMLNEQNPPDIRRKATLRLVEFPYARKGDYLKVYAHIADDPDYTVSAAGLRALNISRAKGYTDLFVRCLKYDTKTDEPLVRLEAADCLANIPDPAAVGPLIISMQTDPYLDVRIASAEALRNYHTVEVARALVEMLDDKTFSVAWQARQSLELLSGQDFRYDRRAWLVYISNSRDWG